MGYVVLLSSLFVQCSVVIQARGSQAQPKLKAVETRAEWLQFRKKVNAITATALASLLQKHFLGSLCRSCQMSERKS